MSCVFSVPLPPPGFECLSHKSRDFVSIVHGPSADALSGLGADCCEMKLVAVQRQGRDPGGGNGGQDP